MSLQLPIPVGGSEEAWARAHLGDFAREEIHQSRSIRGGQQAADSALAAFDVTGYASDRNEVYPQTRRGASGLSPYIRHGLISLPSLWNFVGDSPPRDVAKFRDELMWQEYARHLYARTGGSTSSIRYEVNARGPLPSPEWLSEMSCLEFVSDELEKDGWLVNQTRMWFASHWAVRNAYGWRDGEDYFFTHLLDGSRAANRLGWQWTVGAGTGKPYGFARSQVENRAPGLCDQCALQSRCPIQSYPDETILNRVPSPNGVIGDADPDVTAGPPEVIRRGLVTRVWLTAESLGDNDPALAAHRDVPAVFVFDEKLLARLQLSGKRLVFLAETLADLALRHDLQIWLGDPVKVLSGGGVAATYAPVPGWKVRSARIELDEVHPWPWLVQPHSGAAGSFSAWRKGIRQDH